MTDGTRLSLAAAPPSTAGSRKIVVSIAARDLAHRIAGALQDLVEPPPAALTLFEDGPAGWRIEAYYDEPADPDALRASLASLIGQPVPKLREEAVPQENWVALSQAALPPVAAGRFTVHGSHDKARVPQGPNAILVDAGEAFGTAHHATTHGCLLAIDEQTRRGRFSRVLDLGCGSGVLAIAVARALPHARVLASDIDVQSVRVAQDNFSANGVRARIRAVCATGLDHPALREASPFDLLVANILAGPLVKLAPSVARAVRRGGRLVLSGILIPQAPEVIAAYRAAGFRLDGHKRITGWSTLVLTRR